LWALTIEIKVSVCRNQIVGGCDCLPFRRTEESLDFAVGMAVYGSGRPVGAVFRIGKALAVAGFDKFAPGQFGGTPPYACLHTVFDTHHGFHHIVQFIIGGVVTVGSDGFVEVGVVVETAGQLMGIAFI